MAGVPRKQLNLWPSEMNLCQWNNNKSESFAQVSDNTIQYAIVSVNEERKSMAANSCAIDRFLRPECEYRPDARSARITGAAKPAESDERCDREDKAGNILSVMGRSYPLMLAFNCYWEAVCVVGRILHYAACCAGLASSSRPSSIN